MTALARIDRLRWRYSTGDWVLRDIHLQLEPGERVGLVGRSGSGKSSLALTFNGIIPHSYAGQMGGSVIVAGQATTTTSVAELAHAVAMVFQSPDDQMSQILVRHEVASGPANLQRSLAEVDQRTRDALSLLRIEHLAGRETASLSGGEKQKVALAAALAMRPRLLVLDEPTTDLDPSAKADLVEVLQRVGTETTLLIVSHDLETLAPLVERLIIMDEGALAADAASGDLLATPPLLETHGIAVPQLAALNAAVREQRPGWRAVQTVAAMVEALRASRRVATWSEPAAAPAAEPRPAVMQLSGVTFRYPDAARPAVEDVSFSIGRGELVAVVGSNGSGKTTLSKLILGLLRPARGQIEAFDQPVLGIRPDRLGYIYQNPDAMLSQMTVRDEVAFTPRLLGRADWSDRTEAMLIKFGLDRLDARFPLALSKGQRQRLAYAAVTAAGPPMLIFDEPTTGIDQPGCDQIMAYMDSLRREQKTIVFITHDMPLAMRWADRILVMHNGHLVHNGPPASLAKLDRQRLEQYHLKLPPATEVAHCLGLGGDVATPADLVRRLQPLVAACDI